MWGPLRDRGGRSIEMRMERMEKDQNLHFRVLKVLVEDKKKRDAQVEESSKSKDDSDDDDSDDSSKKGVQQHHGLCNAYVYSADNTGGLLPCGAPPRLRHLQISLEHLPT